MTNLGTVYYGKCVVICTGTYLKSRIIIGDVVYDGGPDGEFPAAKLSNCLLKAGLTLLRFKTGTPPRVNKRSIDFTQMEEQPGDDRIRPFSFDHDEMEIEQVPCWLTHTNENAHKIIRDNLHRSPLYSGVIEGKGPRYCPSIEDKVVKFPGRDRHHIFIEPMGKDTYEMYLAGLSSSLPEDVQIAVAKTVRGLEDVKFNRCGYAIEYDFIFPDQIERTLALKRWRNVFPAGQINGTSGYEEAGGQGLLAGLNAARTAAGLEPVVIPRELSYLGVMVDDLVTKDIIEPYRLFTSRSEYRLRLRQDNADLRLCELAKELNLLPFDKYRSYVEYNKQLNDAIALSKSVKYQGKTIFAQLKSLRGIYYEGTPLPCSIDGINLDLKIRNGRKIIRQLAILAHYEGYLEREEQSISKLQKLENWKISADFDYNSLSGLCNESKIKLNKVRPTTLAQASRIDGVTPVEIALLQVSLTRISKSAGR